MALVDLLGSKLVKAGNVECSTSDALAGKKAVALYFSAHWCPPCKMFTPMLGDAYKKSLQAKGMEVIFVSSDKNEGEWSNYFGEMPWLALPYAERGLKDKLSKKYKVRGIPTLVILDGATGETITTDGRECISEDPEGKDFPWKPPSFWDALGSEFLSGADGDTVEVDELKGKGKYIGLYFSAHWCPPCRGFTPELIKAYTEHLKAKNLEIIFVSSDRDAPSFMEYYGTMPWLAIPNGDARKNKLSKLFGVEGIPSFVVIDAETGETLNGNARGKVSSDPTGAEFPWLPSPINDLNDGPDGINDEPTLCVMLEGCDAETQKAAKAALLAVAEPRKAAKEELLFFYATQDGQVSSQVRQLTKRAEGPCMVLLDIPDNGGYYVSPAGEFTAETISGFLEAYKAGALERQQLG